MRDPLQLRSVRAAVILLLVFSVLRFGYETVRILDGGFVDFPLFWQQALEYVETGQVYPAADELARFEPRAPIYKFPPLYMALLVPWAALGVGSSIFAAHWAFQILLYLGAGLLCFRAVAPKRRTAYGMLLAIAALNYEPFLETLYGLQVETWLLALVATCLWCTVKRFDPGAGLSLATAAMLKVYPAYLAIYFVVRRRWLALIWFGSGALMLLALSLVVLGVESHLVFFRKVLPFMLAENPDAFSQNVGLGRYLQTVTGMTPGGAKSMTRVLALLPLGGTVWALLRSADDGRSRALGLCLLIPTLLLTLPNSWSNYQLFLLVPFAVLLGEGIDGVLRRGVLVLVLAGSAYALTLVSENTPYLLSAIPIPEPLYDPLLAAKLWSPIGIWLALYVSLADRRRGGAAAG